MSRKTTKDTKRELPGGWRWVRLKEMGIFEAGGTPAKERDDYWNGEIPFVTGADITELNITKSNARAFLSKEGLYSGKTAICEEGTVLIVTRTRVGRTGIAQETMGASQDISAFKCGLGIDPEFLCRYLHNISKYLTDNCRGATIQGLPRDFVDNIEIPLPPLSEQRRIAAVLREQMGSIEQARAAAEAELETINALPAALLRRAFAGEV
jgi:type I restriction enzyme S subunit